MNCSVGKSKLYGNLTCPTNKSYTHRAIFMASLSDGKSIIQNPLLSQDTIATIEACKVFGVNIQESDSDLIIKNSVTSTVHAAVIDAENSGTTIRIAASIASLIDGKSVLSGDQSLKKRPMGPLLDALESIGAKCTSDDGKPPITVTGKVLGGSVKIQGDISSQFITSLLIIGARTQKGLTIQVKGELVSRPYLDMTISMMKKFGVDVDVIEPFKKYHIPAQMYKPTTLVIPSDFSSLAILLAAAVLLGDKLTINIKMGGTPHGDEAFIDMLERLGADIVLVNDTITTASPKLFQGGTFDLGDTPDLLPALAILALKSTKPIKIKNVKHARFKETDRIAVLSSELAKIGLIIKESEDGMTLEKGDLHGAHLDAKGDHRLFMVFCIAGMYIGDCTVSDPESVGVSYPEFISDMKKVGGEIN